MYIFKNAWTSIARNKGRNILMAIIVIVISASSAVTLSIKNSAKTIINAYEDSNSIIASIGINRTNLMHKFTGGSDNAESNIDTFNSIESLTAKDIENYGDSDYVSSYYHTSSISMNGSDIDAATSSFTKVNGGGGRMPNSTGTTETVKSKYMAAGNFILVGYTNLTDMSDFIDGTYTVADGEITSEFLTSTSCLISGELATLNELSVGDVIELESPNDDDVTIKLTIAGTYIENEDSTTSAGTGNFNMFSNSANQIITNNDIVNTIAEKDDELIVTITPKFTLTSSDDIANFEIELAEKGLDENYAVTTNLEEIQSKIKSISNLNTFATTFLIVTLIIGGIVLFVINMINIRERKYEIGVLRAIGMKKSIVSLQFVTELLIVAFAGLVIGAGIGAGISMATANALLQNEIENASNEQNQIANNFGRKNFATTEQESTGENSNIPTNFNGVNNINEVASINAVVNFKVLLELLGIGLLLTLVSSIASMISIARFSPLTILKERS